MDRVVTVMEHQNAQLMQIINRYNDRNGCTVRAPYSGCWLVEKDNGQTAAIVITDRGVIFTDLGTGVSQSLQWGQVPRQLPGYLNDVVGS